MQQQQQQQHIDVHMFSGSGLKRDDVGTKQCSVHFLCLKWTKWNTLMDFSCFPFSSISHNGNYSKENLCYTFMIVICIFLNRMESFKFN